MAQIVIGLVLRHLIGLCAPSAACNVLLFEVVMDGSDPGAGARRAAGAPPRGTWESDP